MTKNTRVHRSVDALKKAKEEGAAKVLKPGADKAAKKLGDEHDDKWEAEETKKGYWTPAADDTTGYASKTSDNADDDFKHGSWTDETKAKKYGKKLIIKNKQTPENSSRAYKQIGLVLAEAMGHRVDEIAPLAAVAGAAARFVGSQALRRGAVALGRKAAPGTAKRGLSVAARKAAKDPDKMKTLGAGLKAGYKKIKGKITGAGDQGTIPDDKEAEEELKVSDLDNVQNEGTIMNNAYSVYSRLAHIFLEGGNPFTDTQRAAGTKARGDAAKRTPTGAEHETAEKEANRAASRTAPGTEAPEPAWKRLAKQRSEEASKKRKALRSVAVNSQSKPNDG